MTWDALRKSLNGLVNKVNASNLKHILPEVFSEVGAGCWRAPGQVGCRLPQRAAASCHEPSGAAGVRVERWRRRPALLVRAGAAAAGLHA